MAERPLLIFPRPTSGGKAKLPRGRPGVHIPSHSRQIARLEPKFRELQRVFKSRAAELRESPTGIIPDQVVVFETVGSVEEFLRAVKRTRGMEWLVDWEDLIEPDKDFYHEKNREAKLSGRLYLVMTNQTALDQMVSLWRKYKRDREVRFAWGLRSWSHLLDHLKDVRRWGVKDRLEETGIAEEWRESIHRGDKAIRFEVELWCRERDSERKRAFEGFSEILLQQKGRCVSQCCIPPIAYHGVLVEAPASAIAPILRGEHTKLVQAEQVMFFRPLPQATTPTPQYAEPVETWARERLPMPHGEPVVALLDGMPLENHDLLRGRLVVDDPDEWRSDYQAYERHHGTAMASLILHGDLGNRQDASPRPIYVRPIMKPDRADTLNVPPRERVPMDVLPVDLIHRAVKRILEGEGNEPPVAPSVKVVNISLGDERRPFVRTMSPWARLLDWLSHEYDLLFVVSAGNCGDIIYDCSDDDFKGLENGARQALTLSAMQADERHRSILSPAESINAITVGSIHSDNSNISEPTSYVFPVFCDEGLPSPYSRTGPGYRRSVKPDILLPGGRALYVLQPLSGDSVRLRIVDTTRKPGQIVASCVRAPGDTRALHYTRGTSNSAALVSRAASMLYDSLLQLRDEPNGARLEQPYFAVLLKALLVHGACWQRCYDVEALRSVLCRDMDKRTSQDYIARYLGYGCPDLSRVTECAENRATILGCGSLGQGFADSYKVPLPPSLSAQRAWRRLAITLAWFSPTNPQNQRYRQAKLWICRGWDVLGLEGTDAWWETVQRGTVQHIVFEGKRASAFSRGDALEIKVSCAEDSPKLDQKVKYGLAATLEVSEQANIPVYSEIRERLYAPIRVTPQA